MLVARQVGDPEHTKEVIVTAKTRWDSPPIAAMAM